MKKSRPVHTNTNENDLRYTNENALQEVNLKGAEDLQKWDLSKSWFVD